MESGKGNYRFGSEVDIQHSDALLRESSYFLILHLGRFATVAYFRMLH